jgi:hypothetical protein
MAHVAPLCNSRPKPEKALRESRFHLIVIRYFLGFSNTSDSLQLRGKILASNDINADDLAFPALAEVSEQPTSPQKNKTSYLSKSALSNTLRQILGICFFRSNVTMAGSTNRLFLMSLVAAIFPIIYLNWYTLLNKYAGRIDMTDASHLIAHANHGPVNNEKCWTFPGTSALRLSVHELTISRGQSMRGCENTS